MSVFDHFPGEGREREEGQVGTGSSPLVPLHSWADRFEASEHDNFLLRSTRLIILLQQAEGRRTGRNETSMQAWAMIMMMTTMIGPPSGKLRFS